MPTDRLAEHLLTYRNTAPLKSFVSATMMDPGGTRDYGKTRLLMDAVSRLCAWYELQCTEDWHEDHGIRIDTLDNPGWSLKIDLRGTPLGDAAFQEIKIERSDRDWITARRAGDAYEAFGGPNALGEMIAIFITWAESATKPK